MTNACCTPTASAKCPSASGISAPPTIAATIRLEPLLVSGPSPDNPTVKMLGNITELNSPTARIAHIAVCPCVRIDVTTSPQATTAAVPSTVLVRTFVSNHEPINRPTIAPPQYNETYFAAVLSGNAEISGSPKYFTRKLPIETSAPT